MNKYSLGLALGLGSIIISYFYFKNCKKLNQEKLNQEKLNQEKHNQEKLNNNNKNSMNTDKIKKIDKVFNKGDIDISKTPNEIIKGTYKGATITNIAVSSKNMPIKM